MRQITSLLLMLLFVSSTMLYGQQQGDFDQIKMDLMNQPQVELAPGTYPGDATIASDADYDLQFEYPVGVGEGEAGIETDGTYIYTTKWNGVDFYRYETDGTYLESFTIAGAGEVRDLAFDGTYFYGGAAATTVFEMDFDTETLISTFTAPTAVRAIGYDEVEDGFWANNWSTTLTLFDRSGATLNTIATNGDESFYGLAYDPQGPYLWGYSQRTGSSQNILYKYELPTGTFLEEFDVLPLLTLPVTGDIAGGLAFHPDIVPGTYTIMGLVQNVCLWGLEMGITQQFTNDVAISSIVSPSSGIELTADEPVIIKIKNTGTAPQSNIPWEVTWTGQGSGSFSGTLAGPLAEGEEVELNVGTADLSEIGTYNFEACTDLAGDENPGNDCKTKAVTNDEPSLCVDNLYTSGCGIGDQLTSWDLANINVPSIPCAGTPEWYQDYMDLVHELTPGETYELSVTAGYGNTYFAIWVDWDNNLDLTADEMILDDLCTAANTVYTFDFVVPADAPAGEFVMRARTNWQSPATDPCATYSYGNCCDFTVLTGPVQPEPARVQVIHNSADLAAEVVDVWLDDVKLIENFAFRTATPFIDAPTGVEFTIAIQPPGSTSPEDPLWSQDYTLDFDETYLLVASGIVSASGYDPVEPFDIYVFPLAREEATQASNTDLLAFHGSTDAPTVTIWETGVGAGEIIDDFSYGDFAGYLELETLDYVIEVRDETGTVVVASYSAPLASLGLDGAAITAVASGFLDPSNNSNGAEFGIWVALASGGDLIPLPVYPPPSTGNPPENLQAELIGDDSVLLTWDAPMEDGEWYHWDSGTNFDGIGLTDGGVLTVAARWTPDQLGALDGNLVTKVALFPRSDLGATFTLKIYEGVDASTLLVSEDITATLVQEEWNTITLTTPVEIDGTTELWVGYEVEHDIADYPAGTDEGPAVAGFGDMVTFDGGANWDPLSSFGLDYNWNIQIFVTDGSDGAVAQPIAHSPSQQTNVNPQLVAGNLKQAVNNTMNTMRNVLGYNVYRDDDMIAEEISDLEYLDEGLEEGTYDYTVKAVYAGGLSDPAGPVSIYVPGAPTGDPEINFDPTSLTETHPEPDQITTQTLMVSNTGEEDLVFDITVQRAARVAIPESPDPETLAQLYAERELQEGGVSANEKAPGTYPGNATIPSDADYDLQFEYPVGVGGGEAGIETDGTYIYTTKWNGADFYRYETDGTYLESFTISGAGEVRDLAYDGTYFYGGAAATTVFEMDFDTETLISTFTAPTAVRAIGYDEGEDGFWANNWSTTITLFDRTGATLNTIPANGDESFYGFAYDPQGPYLWGYSQRTGTSQNILYKYELSTGTFLEEFDVFPLLTLPVVGDIAGGLAFYPDIVPGTYSIIGMVQNICIWGLEMGITQQFTNDVAISSIVSPTSGIELTADEPVIIKIKNTGTAPQSNIPWEVTWTGQGSGSFSGTLAGPLAEGEEVELNVGTADLSAFGTYDFEACTDLAGDENPGNDCKTKAVTNDEPSLCVDNLYTSGCGIGDQLTSWDLANINVPSIPCAGTPEWYQDYTDQVHELEAGETYQLTVTAGYNNTFFAVWIDFDGNLDLTMDEMLLSEECAVANSSYTFDLEIPSDVEDGTFVLRARTNWQAPVTDPCATYSYGNCVDFSAEIGGGTGPTDEWLTADPLTGTVAPGESLPITVTFNSTGLEMGNTYNGALDFASNDPASPHSVPATLIVDDQTVGPIIDIDPMSLTETHDDPPQTTSQFITVTNEGDEQLDWSLDIMRSRVTIPQGLDDAAYAEALAQRMTEEGSPVVIGRTAAGGASPNMTDDEVIRYDDGVNNDAIGLTAGGTFNVAAYFPASTMAQYSGMELNQVEVYINDVPNPMVLQIFGQGTTTVPGDLLASQTVTPSAESWIMIDLDTPVDITGEDLWIGYEVTHPQDAFPAGCDAGPAVAGFGDMISLDGSVYEPMSALGLDYNWNIAGYLVEGGPALPNDVGVQSIVEPTSGVELSASEPVVIKIKNYGTNSQSNIPWEVTWTGAGSGSFSGTLAGPLAEGEEAEVTAGTADLSAYGVYTFEACTDLSGDENAANDCKTKAVENIEPSLCVDNLYSTGCSVGDQLTSWDLANINVPSIPCSGTPEWYQDYMDQVHELQAGQTYELTVTAGYANTFFAVWIDFDGNLDLTMDEMLLSEECVAEATPYTFDLVIPSDVEDGTYVMRARTNWLNPVTDPCETYSYGNCVDFSAEIGGGTGPSDWLTADPMDGSLAPGASEQVEVTFNSAGLAGGTYNGALIFSSNDPNSPHTVAATLNVGGVEDPEITVTPDELEELHETPDLITEQTVEVGNTGGADLEWTLEVERSMLYKSSAAPVVRGTVPERNAAAAEKAPGTVFGNETIPTDAEYDLQFEYAVGVGGGEAGIETDGTYIYTTKWNGADFYRYQTDGTYLETFTVPGAGEVRDLAFDGTYFYGGAAATTVFEMDFDTETLISSFAAPTAVRAIGYDEGEDGFWANNWSTTLTLFDRSGATLSTIPTNGDESFYGLAYDPQGPYLWGYSQRTGSSQNILYKYALPSGAFLEEFDVFPLLSLPITGDIAGGLAFHPDIVPGTYTIMGIVQNICIWGLEMGFTGNIPWLSADPLAGTVTPGGSEDVTVTFNSTGLEQGTYEGALVFSSNDPANPELTVPVTLIVDGEPPCPFPAPENVTGTEVSPNTVLLEWDEPEIPGGIIRWDDGINNDGIGLTDGGNFQVAAKFTNDQLGEFDGLYLTDVDIFPRSATADFILKVWTGATGTQELLSQPITVVAEEWNTITLDTPIEIDASQDLYIGYETTHDAGDFPAGCDAGPAVEGFGDLIALGGGAWEPMSALGLDYNWNIAGHIGLAADGKQMTDIIQIGQTTSAATSAPVAGNLSKPVNALWMNTVREVLGYDIMRDGESVGTTDELYFYDVDLDPDTYEYKVGAIYDECTSYADAIDVLVTSVSEVATSKVAMYPNPASDVLNIEAGNITQVTIINNLGQVVYNKALEMDNVQINTSNFDKGMYVVRIHTATKVHTEKLIIQ